MINEVNFTEDEARYYIAQFVRDVDLIHRHGVAHRWVLGVLCGRGRVRACVRQA